MSSLIIPTIIWLALITEFRCSRTVDIQKLCPPCGQKVDKNLVCSKPVKAKRMPLLEPHINSGLGVSLKAHNGKYLSLIRGFFFPIAKNVYADKHAKDEWCKFIIEKVGENTIYLKSAKTNKYLTLWGPHDIRAEKSKPDQYCLFTVHEDGGKLILQGDNGLFLGVHGSSLMSEIESRKGGIDEWTRFIVETGSITPVKEEILSVSFGKTNDMKYMKPLTAAVRSVSNRSSKDVSKTVSLEWAHTASQQTSWEHGWGVTAGFTYKSSAGIVGIASASFEFSLEINTHGTYAGNRGTSETITLTETQPLTVAPGTQVTAELLVSKIDGAELPFTAKIRRTSEVGTVEFEERGTWKGVLVWKTWLDVKETKL